MEGTHVADLHYKYSQERTTEKAPLLTAATDKAPGNEMTKGPLAPLRVTNHMAQGGYHAAHRLNSIKSFD